MGSDREIEGFSGVTKVDGDVGTRVGIGVEGGIGTGVGVGIGVGVGVGLGVGDGVGVTCIPSVLSDAISFVDANAAGIVNTIKRKVKTCRCMS